MQAEVEYNSCEAQRDRILSYVKSQEDLEVYREYSDPGFSAATLDRPALKELMSDIVNRKIDVVLTYKIDRLTRSAKDFYNLIECFKKSA
jgi:site-specific DNA recombinase